MAMKNYNRVKFVTSTTGQGDPTVGTALGTDFGRPADVGYVSGETTGYIITEVGDVEVGLATIGADALTFARTTVYRSIIAGVFGTAKMNLQGAAIVRFGPVAELSLIGPASSTDANIATFSGTGGNILQDSGVGVSAVLVSGGALGTPSSGNASNLTNFPTLNQNTTGTAAGLSATLAASSGGTGVANNVASTITISGSFGTTLTVTGTTTVTLPTSGTLATLAGTETLSGKTLTAPKFASGGFLADANGNEHIIFTTTADAVNEVTYANAATGANPTLTASGETNVGLTITGKGTKGIDIGNVFSEKVVTVTDGAGFVIDASLGNIFKITAAADRTAGTTTNPKAGQKMILLFSASGGARTLTVPVATTGDFAFGSDITALTQTASGKTDAIGCIYDTVVANRWAIVAVAKGY